MALWDRVKGAANKVIDFFTPTQPAPRPPPEPPPAPPLIPPPPIEPPPEEPPLPPPGAQRYAVYDEYDNIIGYQTWQEWWRDTLAGREMVAYKYGMSTKQLIENIELSLGIQWDWKAWREEYAASHG